VGLGLVGLGLVGSQGLGFRLGEFSGSVVKRCLGLSLRMERTGLGFRV
jgi:hypothetical protein